MVTNNGHTKLYVLKHIMDFRNFLNKHTCFFVSFFYLFHDTISEAFLMSCRLLCSIFLQEKNLHYSISDSQIYTAFLTVDANEQHYQLSIIGENCDQKNRMTKGNPLNRKHSYATLCMLAVSFSHFTNEKFPIYFHCNFSMTFFFLNAERADSKREKEHLD